ncbi:hypothetical protein [uncultured Brachyspira sp.]|jgi:hypothetical protein|uniref:hypothetical protein n=1 Tax=uncultured Brachyspira sp. TaxID=221953 RepID=UPI003207A08F
MELDDEKIKALENFCRKKICSDKILDLEDKKERTEYYDSLSKSITIYSNRVTKISENLFEEFVKYAKESEKRLSEWFNKIK